jgi:hypothetical protein
LDLIVIFEQLQSSALSEWLRTSLKAIPIINAVHVMALAIVFGTILMVDLRLLGFNVHRSFKALHRELLGWTWGAFGIAAVSGGLLLIVNATTYYRNTAFWLKMGVIVLAGINMVFFEHVTAKTAGSWDKGVTPPAQARAAGAISLLLWLSVIVLGRWIGFTKGYDFTIPEDVQFDFSAP